MMLSKPSKCEKPSLADLLRVRRIDVDHDSERGGGEVDGVGFAQVVQDQGETSRGSNR